ncbi:MAG TPA: hypothetical protein VHK28_02630, partial [Candidatus Limnocylindria bacterium]|nr:hypothetical protein [Candidatus Limnocylindria bacterium]
AVVVPFPNAVDRSVRLTGSGGSGATLCLPVGSRPWTFASVELHTRSWVGTGVWLRMADEVRGVLVDAEGRFIAEPGGRWITEAPAEPDQWHRVEFVREGDERFSVTIVPLPERGNRGGVPLPPTSEVGERGEVALCIGPPSGPAAVVYVDNIVVE